MLVNLKLEATIDYERCEGKEYKSLSKTIEDNGEDPHQDKGTNSRNQDQVEEDGKEEDEENAFHVSWGDELYWSSNYSFASPSTSNSLEKSEAKV